MLGVRVVYGLQSFLVESELLVEVDDDDDDDVEEALGKGLSFRASASTTSSFFSSSVF